MENIVQDRIGHEQYGLFAALNALAFLFIVLVDLGINQFVTKKFASDVQVDAEIYSTYFSFKFALAVFYPVFMVAIGYLLGYNSNEVLLLFLISLSYCALQLILYLRAKFQASQLFTIDTIASIADKTVLIVFTCAVLGMGITLHTYVDARLFAAVLALLFAVIPAVKIYSPQAFAFSWSSSTWKTIVRQTYPFALITVLFSVHDKIDQVMIERMLGDHASGLYAGAYRWLDAFMMFLWIILPMFFARFSLYKNTQQDMSHVLIMAQIVSAVPMIFVSCFVWFHGEQLFFLLGNSSPVEIAEMTLCLKILFIAVFIHAYFACLGTLLSATGGEFYINRMLIFSILINVILNVVLLPLMGISGAALATACSTLFISVSYLVYIIKKREVILNGSVYMKLSVCALVTVLSFYLCSVYSIQWFPATVVSGMFLTGAALVCKLHKAIHKL